MSFKPYLSIAETLNHLSVRLDPIIAARLAPVLGGVEWTRVLELLDEKMDTTRRAPYSTRDLSTQLKMFTRRLGQLGYPFDTKDRIVSTAASKLLILRNRNAHNETATVYDAFRAADAAVELLRHFKDEEGLVEALRLRHEALAELAERAGLTTDAAEQSAALEAPEPDDAVADSDDEPGEIIPDHEVMVKESSEPGEQLLGDERTVYEPWEIVVVGESQVIHSLRTEAARKQLRDVTQEIVAYEGPIHIDRLADLAARCFNVLRLSKSRRAAIHHQIQQQFVPDNDRFIWPSEIDAAEWTEFRPNDSSVRRHFTDISPIEVANAMRFIKARHPEITDAELDDTVLRTFGKSRKTKGARAHLRTARERMAEW